MDDSDEIAGIAYALVAQVFNDRSLIQLPKYVAPVYRDFDPVTIPGHLMPRRPSWGTITDLEKFIQFLDSPLTDFHFVVEDTFAHRDRVAVRLFGEGTMARLQPPVVISSEGNGRGSTGASMVQTSHAELTPDRQVLGMVHVVMDSTQVWRLRNSRIEEKWGPWRVRSAEF
jgi:hypothetical protein